MPIISGLTKKVDLLGKLAGFGYGLSNFAGVAGRPAGDILNDIITGAIRYPHFPNIQNVLNDLLLGNANGPLKNMIMGYIGGELMDQLGVAGKWPKIIKDFTFNGAIGVALWSLIAFSTAYNSPWKSADSIQSAREPLKLKLGFPRLQPC